MTLTIGVPFYGDSAHLKRCVRSLLDQTHTDLRVLVVADGSKTGHLPRDSRVDVYRLKENRGAYYARAIALAATGTEFHGVVDADDWVDPEWAERLLAADGDAVQHGARYTEREGVPAEVWPWKHARRPVESRFIHYTSHTGIYRTERLREVGGYSPAYRVGYDSFMCGLLRLTGKVEIVDEPLYHRFKHPDSLSSAPATKIRSEYRLGVRAELAKHYRQAFAVRRDLEKVKAVALSLTPQGLWDEVQEHAERITGANVSGTHPGSLALVGG